MCVDIHDYYQHSFDKLAAILGPWIQLLNLLRVPSAKAQGGSAFSDLWQVDQ
jgi:hypothetical protein